MYLDLFEGLRLDIVGSVTNVDIASISQSHGRRHLEVILTLQDETASNNSGGSMTFNPLTFQHFLLIKPVAAKHSLNAS